MPFNEKNEWVNPPEKDYTEEDLKLGYRVCGCGHGVHLFESGFDAQMFFCGMCQKDVATVKDFLIVEESEKLNVKDEINSPDNYKLT